MYTAESYFVILWKIRAGERIATVVAAQEAGKILLDAIIKKPST
jgi:hypothetical protein